MLNLTGFVPSRLVNQAELLVRQVERYFLKQVVVFP